MLDRRAEPSGEPANATRTLPPSIVCVCIPDCVGGLHFYSPALAENHCYFCLFATAPPVLLVKLQLQCLTDKASQSQFGSGAGSGLIIVGGQAEQMIAWHIDSSHLINQANGSRATAVDKGPEAALRSLG